MDPSQSTPFSLLDIGNGLVDVFAFLRPRHTMRLIHTCVGMRNWFDVASKVAKSVPAYADRCLTAEEANRAYGFSSTNDDTLPPVPRWNWSPISLHFCESHCIGDFAPWVPWLSTVGLARDCRKTYKISQQLSRYQHQSGGATNNTDDYKCAVNELLQKEIRLPPRTIINLRAYALSTYVPKKREKLINDDNVVSPLMSKRALERKMESLFGDERNFSEDEEELYDPTKTNADGDVGHRIAVADSVLRGLVARSIIITSTEGIDSIGNYFLCGTTAKAVTFATEVLSANVYGATLQTQINFLLDRHGTSIFSTNGWEAIKRSVSSKLPLDRPNACMPISLPTLPTAIGSWWLASCANLEIVNFGNLIVHGGNSGVLPSDWSNYTITFKPAPPSAKRPNPPSAVVVRGVAPIGEDEMPLIDTLRISQTATMQLSPSTWSLDHISVSPLVAIFDTTKGIIPLSQLAVVGNWWLADCNGLTFVSFNRVSFVLPKGTSTQPWTYQHHGIPLGGFGPLVSLQRVGDYWLDHCYSLSKADFDLGLPSLTNIGCGWLSNCPELRTVHLNGKSKDTIPDVGLRSPLNMTTKYTLNYSTQSPIQVGNGWLHKSVLAELTFTADELEQ